MIKKWYFLFGILIILCYFNYPCLFVQAKDYNLLSRNSQYQYGESNIPKEKKIKKKNGYQYYINDDGTVTTFYYYGNKKDVVIPSKIDGKKVTSIGSETFLDNFEITSIKIPDTVISIGDCAFSNCTELKSIYIPKSVKSIGDCVFTCSSKLNLIEVHKDNLYFMTLDNVLYSKDGKILYAYAAGKIDNSFTTPDGVVYIKNHAFSDCDNLKNIVILDSVTDIGSGAFAYSNQLESLILSNNITEISAGLVEDCKKIKSIVIPNHVQKIGENAFYGCDNLTSVKLSDSVSQIDALAFYNCNKLTRIDILNNQCIIYDEMDVFDESTVIYCNENSTAMQYALKYGNMYFLLGENIYPKSIILDKEYYVYNGKVQYPHIIIKDTAGNIIDDSHYVITYIGKCKNIGFYRIDVNFKGKYNGRLYTEFKIIPKTMKIQSIKPMSKGFRILWKKQKLKNAYYQIEYATNKKFKNSKKIKIKKVEKKSHFIKKLKPKKKYYVRMRICKGVYKDIYYYELKSEWSKVIKVKTKK